MARSSVLKALSPATVSTRVLGSEAIVLEGRDQSGHVLTGTSAYDPTTDEWRTLAAAAERMRGKRSLYPGLPAVLRTAVTFLLVTLSWVFFRAETLPQATAYLATMFGLGDTQPAAALLAGVTAAPYYLATFAVAAVVTWAAPQTWDWTRRLTPAKGAIALALFLLALCAMEAQGFNPFIYFVF